MYQPALTERDFYALEIGSAGIMRGYMACPCSEEFPLEEKLRCFLSLSMGGYRVPAEEQAQVLAFIASLDVRAIAQQVMQTLFHALEMRFDFKLGDTPTGEKKEETT